MLPREHRLHRAADFTEVVRRGRRASRPLLTVHVLLGPGAASARAGLVVGKTVGGSVVRSSVSRRLRHLLRPRVAALPAGVRLVVRAAPPAAGASSAALGADLDGAIASAMRPRAVRT